MLFTDLVELQIVGYNNPSSTEINDDIIILTYLHRFIELYSVFRFKFAFIPIAAL